MIYKCPCMEGLLEALKKSDKENEQNLILQNHISMLTCLDFSLLIIMQDW